MRKIIVTAEIWKEGNMFTAYCPELDVASCGHSSDDAKKNLNEVIRIQLIGHRLRHLPIYPIFS
jgi:predicted RNase H-like HicB family nuclease